MDPSPDAERHAGHRLRAGRASSAGHTYAVTICCAQRQAFLETVAVRDIVAQTIEEATAYGFARLDAYVVMPEHVHIVFELGDQKTLAGVIGDLKKMVARRVNALLARRGALWQEGYYEHAVRDGADHAEQVWYALENPVRRGLVGKVGEYPWARAGEPWGSEPG